MWWRPLPTNKDLYPHYCHQDSRLLLQQYACTLQHKKYGKKNGIHTKHQSRVTSTHIYSMAHKQWLENYGESMSKSCRHQFDGTPTIPISVAQLTSSSLLWQSQSQQMNTVPSQSAWQLREILIIWLYYICMGEELSAASQCNFAQPSNYPMCMWV